ncbi:hypothetical protein Vadar_015390 [Vaccinium darrowii]|uniref:Uncharacterized protein n=1 Tax=Vaccinium darrowii TaxID=229202 RepID=A0ACB7YEZ7_9ERIC|nr:hypothetical protein Vadar_015390 [Vaccinium darrowii]
MLRRRTTDNEVVEERRTTGSGGVQLRRRTAVVVFDGGRDSGESNGTWNGAGPLLWVDPRRGHVERSYPMTGRSQLRRKFVPTPRSMNQDKMLLPLLHLPFRALLL